MMIREATEGFLFISPWIVGFVVFTVGPIIASLYLSLCRWNMFEDPQFVGFRNYMKMFSGADPKLVKSLLVTTYYTAASVPLNVTLSLLVALLLDSRVKGIGIFRTIYYLPSVASGVAIAILWMWIFHRDFGLLNAFLGFFGIPPGFWLGDEKLVIPAFIFMSLWSVGGNMVIYLAGLQGIPEQVYESAEIDGANGFQRFFHVTLPLLSPVIFFNIVMAIIGSFQVFTQAFIMTRGGPNDASLFYVFYLFQNAFQYFRMGYACAMAWILFLIILSLTLAQFHLAKKWVYYETGGAGG